MISSHVNRLVAVGVVLGSLGLAVSTASAQPLGNFAWQLQPYCNQVSVNVVQTGAVYTLDGWDDQCGGATPRAPLVGTASMNPDGSVGFGLQITTTPGGVPVTVDATISIATLNGTWRDSGGRSGAFVFGAAANGSPRPPATPSGGGDITGVTAGTGLTGGGLNGDVSLAVNPTAVQTRVAGTCPAGQLMKSVNQDGSLVCEAVTGTGGGDITGVTAGAGLTGGGPTGDVTLAVNFAGSGAATTVPRSDHTHAAAGNGNTRVGASALVNSSGGGNTATGERALTANTTGSGNTATGYLTMWNNTGGINNTASGIAALFGNTTGDGNTASGNSALSVNTTGDFNTATGTLVLEANTTGQYNTGVGATALQSNTTGTHNTASGSAALDFSVSGSYNTASGAGALGQLASGDSNTAVGALAGASLSSGSSNLYLSSPGASSESNTIRIGQTQTRAFIGGIRGVTTGVSNAIAVVIDGNGQLGTVSSSRRTKDHIEDLGGVSRAIFDLRPVQFTYKQPFADGTTPVQYGLIAEEVETVLPALVAYNADGEVETVKYHVLPTLLLAEVQRLERERAAMAEELAALRTVVEKLRRSRP